MAVLYCLPVSPPNEFTINMQSLDGSSLQHHLQPRAKQSHKGDYGHSLLVGGNHGYVGAIMLAGIAALKVGSGLVSIATQTEYAPLIPLRYPELMVHGIANRADLTPLLLKATVIGVGPGLGQNTWGKKCLLHCLETDLPLIVDADGLNLLADEDIKRSNWILTPHPGEAACLLSVAVEHVQQNRAAAIRELHEKYGGVIVLKGHHSLIYDGETLYECPTGNPGMASGGMGDLLTGTITGLVAQGLSLSIAAQIGVYIHGQAGDLAAEKGERGLIATDLLPHLHTLVNPDV